MGGEGAVLKYMSFAFIGLANSGALVGLFIEPTMCPLLEIKCFILGLEDFFFLFLYLSFTI